MNFLATILVALLGTQAVLGIPLPKCIGGKGLTKPSGRPWVGECRPCQLSGCDSCSSYYRECYACTPVQGPAKTESVPCNYDENETCLLITECAPCPKGCAGCSIDAAKCEAPMVDCPAKPLKTATAAKPVKYLTKYGKYCLRAPGRYGTGYYVTFTGLVKDGVCLNCADTTPPGDGVEGFGHFIPPYCELLTTARNVAANAFPNCPDTTLVLKLTCHTSKGDRRTVFGDPIRFLFRGTCKANGVTKDIQVVGLWTNSYPDDWDYWGEFEGTYIRKILPASEWTWAAVTAPSARAPTEAVG